MAPVLLIRCSGRRPKYGPRMQQSDWFTRYSREEEIPLERTPDGMLGNVFKIILAVILPLPGVFLEVGLGRHFWINVFLTLPGFIPGVIHAVDIKER